MPLAERFGSGQGLSVGVQVRIISGITTFVLNSISVLQGQLNPERHIVINFSLDGEDFELEMDFTDDTFHDQTLSGGIRTVR